MKAGDRGGRLASSFGGGEVSQIRPLRAPGAGGGVGGCDVIKVPLLEDIQVIRAHTTINKKLDSSKVVLLVGFESNFESQVLAN